MGTQAVEVYDEGKISLIKETVAKGTSDQELQLFLHQCKRTGLDPLSKQIYAVMRWNKKAQREVMTIQTGIDGLRLIADRSKQYAPGDIEIEGEGNAMKATACVKKCVGDVWHEVKATAYFPEYVQKYNGSPNNMWAQFPKLMLGKCAEALALRRAFPAEMSGLYTNDEMAQADVVQAEVIEEVKTETTTYNTPTQQDHPEPQALPVAEGDEKKISPSQHKMLEAMMSKKPDAPQFREGLKSAMGLEHLTDMPMSGINEALRLINGGE